MIYVTGVGPGSEAYLTRRAADVISGADILIGGQRHLDEFAGLSAETRVIDADISGLNVLIAALSFWPPVTRCFSASANASAKPSHRSRFR